MPGLGVTINENGVSELTWYPREIVLSSVDSSCVAGLGKRQWGDEPVFIAQG
jgi:hypothetical protein